MSFPLPNLDDRRWADLVSEAQSLIPLYAPEWTNFNAHDPGITLIELLSWITELNVYRLNRVSDAELRSFLALVGIHPQPPRPARTVLAFTLAASTTGKPLEPLSLPAGLECESAKIPTLGKPVPVRTLCPVTIIPGTLQAVQVDDGTGLRDVTGRWQRGIPFPLFGDNPAPGAALYLGLDTAVPPHVPISLAVTVADPQASRRALEQLLHEFDAQRAACQRPTPGSPCDSAAPTTSAAGTGKLALASASDSSGVVAPPVIPPHHSVQLTWEYLSAPGKWTAVETVTSDSTRALTLDGQVVIEIQGAMTASVLGLVDESLYYLRCRFVDGQYDAVPQLLGLALNAVSAEQSAVPSDAAVDPSIGSTLPVEWLGLGTGWPNLQLTFSQPPVVASTVHVFGLEGGQWYPWQLKSEFAASSPTDRHVVLNPTLGTLTFGDGRHGWVPPLGTVIKAGSLTTLADQGNLPTGAIVSLSMTGNNTVLFSASQLAAVATALKGGITNPIALAGGTAAETLMHAEGRAFGLADTIERAVTLADLESLALATPGTQVARAAAYANVHPDFPCLLAPGIVTLIVVPSLPVGRPSPSTGLLGALAAALARRRVIGTRFVIIAPNYLVIAVQATIALASNASATETPLRVVAALNAFFDPLTGGPDGTGWPFSRDVVRAEVLAVIAQTTGVDHVTSLTLSGNGGPPTCGNICLGFAGLLTSGTHQITVG